MKTRILVPLDGSRLAEQALTSAMTLARGLKAELVLFRAVSIPSDVQEALDRADLKPGPLMEQLETEANEYLDAMSHLLTKTDLSFSHVVQHGLAADAIVDYVDQAGIQLIVMASHGYTGIKRWTHGSVAERVLQSARVPVLLVRAEEKVSQGLPEARPCRRILVPLDGSELAEQVLPAVIPIANALGCEMSLLHVPIISASGSFPGAWYLPLDSSLVTADQDAQVYLDRLAGELQEQGIEASTAVWVGPVAETIVDCAQVNDVDLIAMCTHGRTGIARWALGSIADRILRAGEKPILLVRASRAGSTKTIEKG
jgi:nucleotide-binding universal stress UspA family protein